MEAKGDFPQAREKWLAALRLLPPASQQAVWIQRHAQELVAASEGKPTTRPDENVWAQQRATFGPITPSQSAISPKPRFKWASILSFLAFVVIYSFASGPTFGVGFAVLILIHEMGHFIDVKRRGLPADMPVFLPGLGAYVRWEAMGVSLETRAAVSLAGPLAGLLAAVACAALWQQTGNPLWASLARVGAILNLLNLIPVWVLDGGQAVLALSKTERIVLLGACLALWLVLGEPMFLLVALGAGYQAFFARNFPIHPSRFTAAYFIAVLAALGVIIHRMPGHGLGLN